MNEPAAGTHGASATTAPLDERTRAALRRAFAILTSTKLAIGLLAGVLGCCVVGVTVLRGERAWTLIFSTLWFNGLLVLLALSSAAAFFTRIWRRKLTVVSAGMILFHVSFAALLGGVVFNSLFHFKGVLRLTEGETLPNGDLESYDRVEHGRFFEMGRLRGETTLLRVHRRFLVDGKDKRVAYEISVGEASAKQTGTIYVTRSLEHDGVRYLCLKEGYSLLIVMSDAQGREINGAHVPLQSYPQADGSYLFASGSSTTPAAFPFPPPPERSLVELLPTLRPNTVVERDGDVTFEVWPLGAPADAAPGWSGTVRVGEQFDAGAHKLVPREVRHWVGMDVRYEPGLNVILTSLCLGLAGMVMTFVGRVVLAGRRRRSV